MWLIWRIAFSVANLWSEVYRAFSRKISEDFKKAPKANSLVG